MNAIRPLSSFRNASPFPWLGGKVRMVRHILPLLPPHTTYVEPFGGAANILLAKPTSKVEVYNDASGLLVNFFRVLQDPEQRAALMDRLEYTPYARAEYARALNHLDDPDPVMKAWAFFTAQCQGISGGGSFGKRGEKNWGYSRTTNQAQPFLGHVEKLPAIAERLRRVHIEHGDGINVIKKWDSPDSLFYVDPPYVNSTRSAKSGRARYHCEIENDGQQDLVNTLLNISGNAILSGYYSPLYQQLEDAGWERREITMDLSAAARVRTFNATSDAGKERRKRTECLWLSPDIARQNELIESVLPNDLLESVLPSGSMDCLPAHGG
jgi:DNA adenine methylase